MSRRFTKDHEWIELDGETGTVGVTEYAQKQLGDVVFVEVPEVGRALSQGKDAAVVESVKAASEVYAPMSGTVTEVNPALTDEPAMVNAAPESGAWFFRMKVSNPAEAETLMDEEEYKSFVGGLG